MANYRSKSSRKTRGVSRKRATRRARGASHSRRTHRHRRPLQSGGWGQVQPTTTN
jgi:hypothetical protein